MQSMHAFLSNRAFLLRFPSETIINAGHFLASAVDAAISTLSLGNLNPRYPVTRNPMKTFVELGQNGAEFTKDITATVARLFNPSYDFGHLQAISLNQGPAFDPQASFVQRAVITRATYAWNAVSQIAFRVGYGFVGVFQLGYAIAWSGERNLKNRAITNIAECGVIPADFFLGALGLLNPKAIQVKSVNPEKRPPAAPVAKEAPKPAAAQSQNLGETSDGLFDDGSTPGALAAAKVDENK